VIEHKIAQGEAVSPTTIKNSFPPITILGLSVLEYLNTLLGSKPPLAHVRDHAFTVKQFAVQRALVDVGQGLAEAHGDPESLLKIAWDRIDAIRLGLMSRRQNEVTGPIGDATSAVINHIQKIINKEIPGGIQTGLSKLDEMTGGLQRGELVVCAGRPSMGKSMIATSLGRQIAKNNVGVGFFSCEMPKKDVARRLLADEAYDTGYELNYSTLFHQNVSDKDHQAAIDANEKVRDLPMEMDYSSFITVAEIAAKSRAMAARLNKDKIELGVIIIDYLKFIRATKRYAGQRHYEIGEITAGLKGLAKDLNVCILLLAQLNREVEKREGHVPQLADLRESGDIEADADMVWLLLRESYYLARDGVDFGGETSYLATKMMLYLAKQRMGPTGEVELFCRVQSSSIRNPR